MYKLPEDLGTLSAEELKAAPKALRDAGRDRITAGEAPKDVLAEVKAETAKVEAEATKRAALSELDAEDEADVEEEAGDETDEASDDGDAEDDETEDEEPDDGEEAGDETDEAPVVPVKAKATAKAPAARGRTGLKNALAESTKRVEAGAFKATDRAPKKRLGETFENWTEVSANCLAFANDLSAGSDQRFPIATAAGNFAPHMQMSEKPRDNLRMFDHEEITAALCAPLPPVYDLACQNATNRPVKASLPNYAAPRGGVQIYPSPTLEDITTGYGIWDRTMDANPAASKDPCATIKCATPASYYIYGVYRCLTVQNMLAMTFPELVEAYLNRLAALQARKAETTLLEAMAAETTTITANPSGYGAATTVTAALLNYLALYVEQQRWDEEAMDLWLPRWFKYGVKLDLLRRRRTDGGTNLVPSDAAVNAVFTAAGFTPHWFRDSPTWVTPIPKLQVSGRLGYLPRNLEVLVAPRGKFALMDRGELNIGVAGNIMRDNTSLSKNNFTFFFENFEGIVNTTSCPAHVLHFDNLCYNGQQIQDLIINCEGADNVGAAS